jgi:protein subunit release factor B
VDAGGDPGEHRREKRTTMPHRAHILARLHRLGVDPGDIDERFVRGGGPGGQKINKTSSTVWLRHRPTGVEVRCQDERSQASNRERAWEQLCARLEALARSAQSAARQEHERQRRRVRQKSRGQKARMIEAKRHRASIKAARGRPEPD